jgi:hypothetical protein
MIVKTERAQSGVIRGVVGVPTFKHKVLLWILKTFFKHESVMKDVVIFKNGSRKLVIATQSPIISPDVLISAEVFSASASDFNGFKRGFWNSLKESEGVYHDADMQKKPRKKVIKTKVVEEQ